MASLYSHSLPRPPSAALASLLDITINYPKKHTRLFQFSLFSMARRLTGSTLRWILIDRYRPDIYHCLIHLSFSSIDVDPSLKKCNIMSAVSYNPSQPKPLAASSTLNRCIQVNAWKEDTHG
jgi:hypothetical protein